MVFLLVGPEINKHDSYNQYYWLVLWLLMFFAYGELVRCWNPGVSQICRGLVAVEKGYLREIFAVAIGWEGLEDVLKVWL